MLNYFIYSLGYSYEEGTSKIIDPQAQPNGYRLALTYRNRGLSANLRGIMANGIDKTLYPSKRYAVPDFNLNYDFNEHAMIYFKAYNLTNQSYGNLKGILSTETGERLDYYDAGRSFIGGVYLRF